MPRGRKASTSDLVERCRGYVARLQTRRNAFKSPDELHSLVIQSLTSQEAKEKILSFRDQEALCCMEEILKILEGESQPISSPKLLHESRFELRRLLLRLSKQSSKMPESLFLYGIESAEKYAAAGGGYSDIFRATVGNNPVALKRLRIFQHSRALEDTYSDLCREALVWQQLKHPFILPFLGLERYIFKPYYCIVTPWMSLGNINQFIDEELQNDSKDPLPLEGWLIETARGLRYLHGEHVVHGDIRGANILIGSDKHIRLADFGMSHFADSSSASLGSCSAGAVRWVAPEVLQGARLSYENDIYAYGCFWVEMYTRRRPFFDIPHDFQVVARKLVDGQPAWPSKAGHPRITLNPNNWEFVKSCWADDPSKRPAAAGLAALCLARLYDTTDSTEPISHGHGISRRRSEPFGRRSLAHDVCDNVSIGDSLKSSPGAARPLESSILANASPHFIGSMSSSPFSFVSGALSGPSRCSPSESFVIVA